MATEQNPLQLIESALLDLEEKVTSLSDTFASMNRRIDRLESSAAESEDQ